MRRPPPATRRAGATIAACVLVAVAAIAPAWASARNAAASPLAEVTRTSGPVRATLTYHRLQDLGAHDDYFGSPRILISRDGRETYAEHVPLHPRLAAGTPVQGETAGFGLRDLDGDGEPEVVLALDSDGAHRCAWVRVYRYDLGGRYVPVTHFWGNTSSSPGIADLDGDGRPEFVSTDDRFAYDFNGYAGSVRPIQIWSFARGRFEDVTRDHPGAVRADAARLWRLYVKDRRALPGSARGLLPAWAAELALLGESSRADAELRRAGELGYLAPAVDGPRSPAGYVAAVKRLLRSTGYLSD